MCQVCDSLSDAEFCEAARRFSQSRESKRMPGEMRPTVLRLRIDCLLEAFLLHTIGQVSRIVHIIYAPISIHIL
jgi:hypothetical protein